MDSTQRARDGTAVQTRRAGERGGVLAALFAPVDISFLVSFRIVFGAVMLWEVWRYFTKGWISRYYIEPSFYFTYYGFDWVTPWGGNGMYIHFAILGLCAFLILAGLFYRAAAVVFFVAFTHVFLLDQTRFLNHFYLVCLISFLLIFLPAHRAGSIEALLRPRLRTRSVPAWTLWLLRLQIGIPYFFGGVAKLNPDWLNGEPMRIWLAARTDFPVIGRFFEQEWMVHGFSLGGLLLDLLVVPLMLWKRTRIWAFAAAVSFHLLNARLFAIGIFPWFMLAATLVFFPPDLSRRIARRIGVGAREGDGGQGTLGREGAASRTTTARRRGIVLALGAYTAFQVLMPLRHFAYPGTVNWTEEGHRFSWHMKLRTKDGTARFTVTDPARGESWQVEPLSYLTYRQVEKMAARPDMILQFCHYLAERERRAGRGEVEVRAEVTASLNGREPQPLVDAAVDLAKVKRDLLPARWIVPLSKPLRHASERLREADEKDGDG